MAANKTTASGKVGSFYTSGNATMTGSYGSATTSISGGVSSAVAGLRATTQFKYGFGTRDYTVSNSGSNASRYLSVVANSKHSGSVGKSVINTHGVTSGSTTWSDSTYINK
ncbi:MAG: hypothetical protein ACRDCW_10820 [Sarcina sp.]